MRNTKAFLRSLFLIGVISGVAYLELHFFVISIGTESSSGTHLVFY